MNILLLHENSEIRKSISTSVQARFGATVLHAESLQAAFEVLLDEQTIELLICEDKAANAKLLKYIQTVGAAVPIVLVGSEGRPVLGSAAIGELDILGTYDPSTPIDVLVELLRGNEGRIINRFSSTELDYCRINTDLLLKVVPLQGDIYVRLSSIKFVRLFKIGDVFNAADLTRYFHEKNIRYLFLKKADCPEFVAKLKSMLASILFGAPLGLPQLFETAPAIHETILELARGFGFTPEVCALVDHNVKLVISTIRKDVTLNELLGHLKKSKSGYLSNHSVVLAHIACCIATRLTWHSDTTFEKLTIAALMHDIALKDDALAKLDSKAEMLSFRSSLSAAEEQQILRHPQASVDSLKDFAALPADVDAIILQHHERPDGSGFPRGLIGNRITPLAALFIIAEDMVKSYLAEGLLAEEFVKTHGMRYPTGNFKKIIDAVNSKDDSSFLAA